MPYRLMTPHFIALLTVCHLAMLALSPTIHAKNIDYVKATFAVEYNNKPTQGENRLEIQRDQDRYSVHFELDHWLSSATQTASFTMNDCEVKPDSYTALNKQPLKNQVSQQLTFDWLTKTATYESEGKQDSFALGQALYDPLSFFFEARCDLIAGKTEFSYPLIYKGKRKIHNYKVVDTQVISTPQGEFKALVVERERSNKNRQTRLYVAPELDYLLVRIEHQESRLIKVVATLKQMDYQMLNE